MRITHLLLSFVYQSVQGEDYIVVATYSSFPASSFWLLAVYKNNTRRQGSVCM